MNAYSESRNKYKCLILLAGRRIWSSYKILFFPQLCHSPHECNFTCAVGVTPGQDLKSVCKQSDKLFLFLFSSGLSSPLTTMAPFYVPLV